MKNAYRLIGLLMAGLLFIAATVQAQDWPQWRGVNRDGKVTGFVAPATWPKELAPPTWKVEVGLGDATPALVGDKIFVFARQGTDEVTLCLGAADGKQIWKHADPAEALPPPSGRAHGGPRSSPAVAGGKVVTLGVSGNLTCLDAATGNKVWAKNDIKGTPQFFTAFSPIIVDKLVIAHLGAPGAGALVAYDLASGDQKWKWDAEGPAYASPALMTIDGAKQLVTMTEKSVIGIGVADGKLAWQIPFAVAGRMGYNAATPIVDGTTVIYTGQMRGTHAVKIEKDGDKFKFTPVWDNPAIGTQFCTPVLKDGMLYGISDKGFFFALNAKDGKEAWVDATSKVGNYGAMLDAGAVILALPAKTGLIALKPGAKYEEVARVTVAATDTYATPVVVDNRILVKDQNSLVAYTIK